MSKEEPAALKAWRLSGVLLSLSSPLLLVWLSNGPVRSAVRNSFAARLHAACADKRLQADINSQIDAAALDRTLVIYLAVASFVAVIGAVHRAWAHGGSTAELKAVDFAGKCLALAAAVVVLGAALARFWNGKLETYLPAGFWWACVGGLVVVTAGLWVVGYLVVKSAPKTPLTPCEKEGRDAVAGR
jgi:hypothetical protein